MPDNGNGAKRCRFFSNPEKCSYGQSCKFTHADSMSPWVNAMMQGVRLDEDGEGDETNNRSHVSPHANSEEVDALHVKTEKAAKLRAKRIAEQDMPGGLHDNDHEDICEIKIMPTFGEVRSQCKEYLPVNDPEELHLPGVKGLIDRHFRLLREDSIGPLRDAIRAILRKSQPQNSNALSSEIPQREIRTRLYLNAAVGEMTFDKKKGLEFEVSVDQPTQLRNSNISSRQAFWKTTNWLEPDALVCLIDPRGSIVFAEVSEPWKAPMQSFQPPPSRGSGPARETLSAEAKEAERVARKRFENPNRTFISLRIVDSDGDDIPHVLDLHNSKTRQGISLLEFPGMLLPSFYPTLRALQRMQKAGDLPFADLLAPVVSSSEHVAHVPPPAYASLKNFHFNLDPLMNNGQDGVFLSTQHSFDISRLQGGASELDDTQAVALVDSLKRSLALIQGPPGTGKSYTGIKIIQVLLASQGVHMTYSDDGKVKDANITPILCVCYTNHALDQLLELLIQAGVPGVVRIGSRSKSEMLRNRNLRLLAKYVKKTKEERDNNTLLNKDLDRLEGQMRHSLWRLGEADSWEALSTYLEFSQAHHYEELFGHTTRYIDSDEAEKTIRGWLAKGEDPSGRQHRPAEVLLESKLHVMTSTERASLYAFWKKVARADVQTDLKNIYKMYIETKAERGEVLDEVDNRALAEAKVIGVTTSGLARNLNLLRRVNPKVMLCEEAGEVLESHILTALLPSVEHAILIGDHQQLRPQIENYALQSDNPSGRKYSLDVSLFERLVEPSSKSSVRLPYNTLLTQRRMHPSISDLVRQTLYPKLEDGENVLNYPEVAGMKKRLFWLDHARMEGSAGFMSTSYSNDYEVEMVTGLVQHLMRQEVYSGDDVAVLTPYLGQLTKLKRRLGSCFQVILNERDAAELDDAGIGGSANPVAARRSLGEALRVATVDNFQGEEAKVVVVSLVRSNHENRCGFLRTANRINVLLSRAKHGMYIIGNSRTAGTVPMWAEVLSMLKKSGNFGTRIELASSRRPGTFVGVSTPQDLQQV